MDNLFMWIPDVVDLEVCDISSWDFDEPCVSLSNEECADWANSCSRIAWRRVRIIDPDIGFAILDVGGSKCFCDGSSEEESPNMYSLDD